VSKAQSVARILFAESEYRANSEREKHRANAERNNDDDDVMIIMMLLMM
jgi:hypothetical protein